MTHAMEFGTEWKFFRHRLGINLTYYRTNTYNQFFKLLLSPVMSLFIGM